jgi:hypothetical protein
MGRLFAAAPWLDNGLIQAMPTKRDILNGIKPAISNDAKDLIMSWVGEENTRSPLPDRSTGRETQPPTQAPIPDARKTRAAIGPQTYLTFSDLLAAVEACPQCRDYWDKKSGDFLLPALCLWREAGRPAVNWPETSPHLVRIQEVLDCSYSSATLTPKDGTQRPGTPDGSLATETRKPGSLE